MRYFFTTIFMGCVLMVPAVSGATSNKGSVMSSVVTPQEEKFVTIRHPSKGILSNKDNQYAVKIELEERFNIKKVNWIADDNLKPSFEIVTLSSESDREGVIWVLNEVIEFAYGPDE